MNNDHSTKALLKRYLERVYELAERLEGMSPSTSSPASCSETSGARTEHDAHNKITTPLRHSETEGRDGVQRLVDYLESKAATEREESTNSSDDLEISFKDHFSEIAAVYQRIALKLSALRTESPTESEAGGVEECRMAKYHHIYANYDNQKYCHHCGQKLEARRKRRERSESRNSRDQERGASSGSNCSE